MAILVAGGAGYIGSHTVVELDKAGYEVVILDDFSNSSPEVLKRLTTITGKEFPFYEGSILDHDFLTEVFSKEKIDCVIQFAGFKAVGESVVKPLEYYHNNITGTLVLLDVMRNFGVKNIVFSSSATVYGMNNTVPFKEGMPTSATNPYGYTKVMLEQILNDVAFADKEWSVTNLRYFNPIGAHESGLIGENPNGVPNNLMPYITQVALDLVHAFMKENNVEIPYKICPRRAGDIATCYADASRAKEVLGWVAEKDLNDMVRDSWNWQKNNPQGY